MTSTSPLHPVDVVAPVTVYRIVGRRPSAVYVDADMRPSNDGPEDRRLWDQVFLRAPAEVGDQIQDGPSGMMLLTRDGQGLPIRLTPPTPRGVDTAFTHAEKGLEEDRERIRELLKDGSLEVGTPRRLKQPPFRPALVRFQADHPLVVDTPPPESASVRTEPPERHRWGRRA